MKIFAVLSTMTSLLFTSCVSYTKTMNEKPLPLSFTSKKAAQTFYEALLLKDQPTITDENDESLSFFLKLTSPVSWSEIDTPQKKLNAAFKSADRNGSGMVDLNEARQFAKSIKEE